MQQVTTFRSSWLINSSFLSRSLKNPQFKFIREIRLFCKRQSIEFIDAQPAAPRQNFITYQLPFEEHHVD